MTQHHPMTGQRTKTMYLPAFQTFGEIEIQAYAPAQESREDCENLNLDFIRQQIEQERVADLETWMLNFLKYLKDGDEDMAWAEANEQPVGSKACNFESLIGGNLTTIEIEVPV